MLDHLAIQCADVAASAAFYDAVLAALGGGRAMDFGEVIGFGVGSRPEFWIGPQASGEGFRESHIAFTAPDRAAVRAFFDTASLLSRAGCPAPRVPLRPACSTCAWSSSPTSRSRPGRGNFGGT